MAIVVVEIIHDGLLQFVDALEDAAANLAKTSRMTASRRFSLARRGRKRGPITHAGVEP
jgi:hypothetical protein